MLGYDIGGANTKAAFIKVKNGELQKCKVAIQYLPMWRESQKLVSVLLSLRKKLRAANLEGIAVTMTAELSDIYNTKREGVETILSCVRNAFPDEAIFVLDVDGALLNLSQAEKNPVGVAAANWAATGWLVARETKTCVVVDVGSTSTSVIPIIKGKVVAKGKTDLEKLVCGELVYTGSLRTNVAAIVNSLPTSKGVATVSSELFALSADVNLVLDNITIDDYTCETADGREKTKSAALARLARVVCADLEMLTKNEIVCMAKYIHEMQVNQVSEALAKVYLNAKERAGSEVPVIVTGLGKDFIARKAARIAGVRTIIDLATFLPEEAVLATPAFGVAMKLAIEVGENIK